MKAVNTLIAFILVAGPVAKVPVAAMQENSVSEVLSGQRIQRESTLESLVLYFVELQTSVGEKHPSSTKLAHVLNSRFENGERLKAENIKELLDKLKSEIAYPKILLGKSHPTVLLKNKKLALLVTMLGNYDKITSLDGHLKFKIGVENIDSHRPKDSKYPNCPSEVMLYSKN